MDTCTKGIMEPVVRNSELCGTIQKYVLVSWPEIQSFMEHPRWSDCIFCEEIEDHPCPDGSYMVPEEIYEEVYG